MIIEFKDEEMEYQNWLVANSNSYVINTKRYISKNYMPLHRATCYTISKYQKNAAKDAFTGQGYIKVCSSNLSDLFNWIINKGGTGFTDICSKCNPDVSEQFIANKPF